MNEDKIPLTRRVLFEKVNNNKLIVYAIAGAQEVGENGLHDIYSQYEEGRRLALQLGLTPFLYSDENAGFDEPLTKSQFRVLHGVFKGEIKYIYVRNINMMCRYNWTLKYILSLFALGKVVVFTQSGIYPIKQVEENLELKRGVQIILEELASLNENI